MNKKLLRKKLALMLATLKKKRPFYCEVEYIQSTGTQWIDTGYYPNNNTKVEFMASGISADSFSTSSGTWFFGSRQAFAQKMYGSYYAPGSQQLTFNYGVNVNATNVSSSFVYGDKRKFYFDSTGLYIDDVKRITPAAQSAFTSPATMTIFALNNNGSILSFTKYKVHYCKIWDGNTLVRDMIPVLDWDMKPCMYDKITGQLFYNQATSGDDFSYGREIHPVEYLESTGTQYINTGYKPNTNTRTVGRFRSLSWNGSPANYVFGVFESPNNYGFNVGSARQFFNVPWGTSGGIKLLLTPQLNTDYDFDISKNGYKINGTSYDTPSTEQINSTRNMYVFWSNGTSATGINGRIYYMEIYDNGTLVRDYIPMIDENGIGAMFDKVTHTIFDNAGTGAFKYPPVELEYIESSGTQYIDTGVIGSDKTRMEIICQGSQTNKAVAGCGETDDRLQIFAGGTYYSVRIDGAATTSTTPSLNKAQIILDAVSQKTTVDGTIYSLPYTGSIASRNIHLFRVNRTTLPPSDTTTNFIGKIWLFKLYDNDTLVRDFIPVFYNGSAGMWDKVNDVFYSNAGTGTFVAGRVKEDEYE